ncbi:aspartate aminotransferase family protein [Elusimicrobiota bacterium]
MSFTLPVYKKLNIKIEKADGKYIWDKGGKKYMDFISGVAVTNLGHRHPRVVKSIEDVMSRYLHLSNLYVEEGQEKLASDLITKTIEGKVFFSNSGAEANECAIKIARKYFDGEKYEIISFINSFHGRTLATLAATGQHKFREGFGPMPEGFIHAEYNFLGSVEDKINFKTCAVMVESIQCEGGINVATEDFMKGLRKLCDDKNILLILDEVQTGMGRTGKFLGIQNYGVEPDMVVMGKALGGGLPLGATIVKDKIAKCMNPGDHGSTFGGNPLSCAAGLAMVQSIDNELLKDINKKGKVLVAGLKNLKKMYEGINEIRGKGLIVGMELDFEGEKLVKYLRQKGYLVNCTQDKVIRFMPPFIIEEKDINDIVSVIENYFQERGEK